MPFTIWHHIPYDGRNCNKEQLYPAALFSEMNPAATKWPPASISKTPSTPAPNLPPRAHHTSLKHQHKSLTPRSLNLSRRRNRQAGLAEVHEKVHLIFLSQVNTQKTGNRKWFTSLLWGIHTNMWGRAGISADLSGARLQRQTKKPWVMQTITVKDAALFNSNLSASFQKKVAEEENYSPLSKYHWSA